MATAQPKRHAAAFPGADRSVAAAAHAPRWRRRRACPSANRPAVLLRRHGRGDAVGRQWRALRHDPRPLRRSGRRRTPAAGRHPRDPARFRGEGRRARDRDQRLSPGGPGTPRDRHVSRHGPRSGLRRCALGRHAGSNDRVDRTGDRPDTRVRRPGCRGCHRSREPARIHRGVPFRGREGAPRASLSEAPDAGDRQGHPGHGRERPCRGHHPAPAARHRLVRA